MNDIEKALQFKEEAEAKIKDAIRELKSQLPEHVHMHNKIDILHGIGGTLYPIITLQIE